MAEVIFRYINGVLRPITVSKVIGHTGKDGLHSPHRQVPKQTLAVGHYRSAYSFTVPNATCQVCRAQVFYYEHPNGARVLFDELGPPWPKHPCYEAGQEGKSASNQKRDTKHALMLQKSQKLKPSPNWEKQGWQPLVYEKDVLLQSSNVLRVQGRTSSFKVRFEIPLPKLPQRHSDQTTLQDWLILAKVDRKGVAVQMHNGIVALAFRGVVVDSNVDIAQSFSDCLSVSELQMRSLRKLDGPISFNRDKVWHVEIFDGGNSFKFKLKNKHVKHLTKSPEHLEAWVSPTSNNGHMFIYLIDSISRRFVRKGISANVFNAELSSGVSTILPDVSADRELDTIQKEPTEQSSQAVATETDRMMANSEQKSGQHTPIEKKFVEKLPLSETIMPSLCKLSGTLDFYRDKVWYLEIVHGGQRLKFQFSHPSFKHLALSREYLEAWVTKLSKKGRRIVYIVDRKTRQYVMSDINTKTLLRYLGSQNSRLQSVSLPVIPEDHIQNAGSQLTEVGTVNEGYARTLTKTNLQLRDVKVVVKPLQNKKLKSNSPKTDREQVLEIEKRKEVILSVTKQVKRSKCKMRRGNAPESNSI